jgi:hypothetical protein
MKSVGVCLIVASDFGIRCLFRYPPEPPQQQENANTIQLAKQLYASKSRASADNFQENVYGYSWKAEDTIYGCDISCHSVCVCVRV